MKTVSLKWLNTVSLAVTVAVNILANIIPIGALTTGEISEMYPNLFTPAPLTFGIWGAIYLLMTLFVLYGWGVLGSKESSDRDVAEIGVWFAVGCLCNVLWIFAWHFDVIWLSTLFIVGLFASLAVIAEKTKKTERRGVPYIAVNVGFDLYLGWIIAAVIANVSVMLVSFGVDGFGTAARIITPIIIVIGALIGALPVLFDRKWFSTAAVVWAYIGILIRQLGESGYAGKYPFVAAATVIGIALMLSAAVLKALSKKE